MSYQAPSAGLILGKFRLPLEERAPGQARDLVERVAAGWGLEEVAWTAKLAVSELVTNALLHSGAMRGTTVTVEVLRVGRAFHVAVHDPSKLPPRTRVAEESDETGRGLELVESTTDLWGYRPTPFGKAVWFEIATDWPFDMSAAPAARTPAGTCDSSPRGPIV